MLRAPRTIRARLVLINLLVMATTLAAVSAVLLRIRERDLLEDFDERLRSHADRLLESWATSESAPGGVGLQEYEGYVYQVWSAARPPSAPSDAAKLPLSAAAERAARAGTPHIETTDWARPDGIHVRLRVLTLWRQPSAGPPFVLQMGRDLQTVQHSIATLRRAVFSIVPLGVLLAGLASYVLARQLLRPIRDVVQEARALSASHLGRRLPLPPGADEMVELVRTLNDMLNRLDRAFRAQQRFIDNASHELMTPLSVMLGEVSLLKQKSRTAEEYDQFCSNLEDEIRSLANVIRSLLTLARATAGLAMDSARAVPVNDLVTEAVQRCQVLAEQREVRLVTRLALPDDHEPETVVLGDGPLLVTMLSNLIRNAVRYSPIEQPVHISAGRHGDHQVLIVVRDAGPGIPPQHLERIFDEFFRAPDGQSSYEGVGLGLTIARSVAELHGGSIAVRNHPQGGCEFSVRLPLLRPHSGAALQGH